MRKPKRVDRRVCGSVVLGTGIDDENSSRTSLGDTRCNGNAITTITTVDCYLTGKVTCYRDEVLAITCIDIGVFDVFNCGFLVVNDNPFGIQANGVTQGCADDCQSIGGLADTRVDDGRLANCCKVDHVEVVSR